MGFKAAPLALLRVLYPEAFPSHMFYGNLLEETLARNEELRELCAGLGDEKSCRVLQRLIGFRLTLEAELLRPIVDEAGYLAPDVVALTDDEVYVVAGAYDGDTTGRFIERVGGRFTAVYAFEPDRDTYPRLAANFRDEPQMTAVAAGLSRASGERRFRGGGGRGSMLTDDGETIVPVASFDQFLSGSRVTYVKMNIEGAELKALAGASEAIRRWKPRLAVAAHHRPSHL